MTAVQWVAYARKALIAWVHAFATIRNNASDGVHFNRTHGAACILVDQVESLRCVCVGVTYAPQWANLAFIAQRLIDSISKLLRLLWTGCNTALFGLAI